MTTWTPRSHNDYTVGWIYSVPMEMPVARLVPDEIHPPLPRSPTDHNTYVLGSLAGYSIAIAFPEYDLRASTEVARDLINSFPSVRFIVFVGIGGGIPSSDRDIRLGDVVIAEPSEWSGRVIQTTNMDSPTVSRDSEYPAISARSSFGGMDDLGPTMLSTDSGYGSTTYNTSAGVDEASSAGPPVSSLNPFLAAPNEYDFFNTMTPAPSGPESGETFDSGYYETGLWDEMSLAMPPANSGDAFHSTNNVFGSEDPYIHSGMDEVNSTMLFADVTFSSWDTSDGADRNCKRHNAASSARSSEFLQ
ncbi:hypothetical protein N7504_004504 [Penicillium tannophilum]|nr:hypothetical protein N7504_004504 [Penicillium tannophilum]